MAVGICSLTGKLGTFVKSHMVPLAFTKPTVGAYFVEGGPGVRPFRRHTSWYDPKLVTRAGEDVLADLDSRAAVELRRMKLVWSGWADEGPTFDFPVAEGDKNFKYRLLQGHDHQMLRRFFVSLIWRAAASRMKEFSEVQLSEEDLERARLIITRTENDAADFLPVQIVQLSSKGPHHNLGPIKMSLPFRSDDFSADLECYRFYFDGLVVRYFLNVPSELFRATQGIYLGGEHVLQVLGIPYEESFQRDNMVAHFEEAIEKFPNDSQKLLKGG